MKIRLRFSKQGQMKFIGHLDMVRYFQKVMRRSEVDVAYSEGFSPHQKMSFAAPLSVGVLSRGEYFDLEVNSTESSKVMLERINAQNAEGVEVLSYKLLPDDAKNAMSVVAGADYKVYTDLFNQNMLDAFMNQDQIIVLKKTKKRIIKNFLAMSSTRDGLTVMQRYHFHKEKMLRILRKEVLRAGMI